MSFSADWLALREPADHAARNADVLAAAAAHFAGRDHIDIVDLGCGAGSNLRGCALAFPRRQSWRLIDYDPALLDAARRELTAWADTASSAGDDLQLQKGEHSIAVTFVQADLSGDAEGVLSPLPDLVTAAALFDLMSAAWIGRFVASLAARKLPLYTVLIYDGQDRWSPPHPLDEAVNRAFCTHQRTDKGFGPAAGPEAGETMVQTLDYAGYKVVSGQSTWRLGPGERALTAELVKGIASAAVETGMVTAADAKAWRTSRAKAEGEIGHLDLFAAP